MYFSIFGAEAKHINQSLDRRAQCFSKMHHLRSVIVIKSSAVNRNGELKSGIHCCTIVYCICFASTSHLFLNSLLLDAKYFSTEGFIYFIPRKDRQQSIKCNDLDLTQTVIIIMIFGSNRHTISKVYGKLYILHFTLLHCKKQTNRNIY